MKSIMNYELGDVIMACITDYTMLGDEFSHQVTGTIVASYSDVITSGFDIKLFKPIYFECMNPSPKSEQYSQYVQPNPDPSITVFRPMDVIFVDQKNIIRHYPQSEIASGRILPALRYLWKDLVFREVKTVIRNHYRDLLKIEYISVDDNGQVQTTLFKNLKDAFSTVPKQFHRNIKGEFANYYGFTTDVMIRPNDPYAGQEIFFSKKCYDEINLGEEPTAWFSNKQDKNSWPPRQGQIICGIVEKGEKGLFFRRWFNCSRQFLTLWTMVCASNHHSMYKGSTPKRFGQMLIELDTKPLHMDYNLPLKTRQENFHIFNVESVALQSIDKYVEIAKLVFPPESIIRLKEYYAAKTASSEVLNKPFLIRFYEAVMWFLPH